MEIRTRSKKTYSFDGLDDEPRKVEEELGAIEDAQGRLQLVGFRCILQYGEEDLVRLDGGLYTTGKQRC